MISNIPELQFNPPSYLAGRNNRIGTLQKVIDAVVTFFTFTAIKIKEAAEFIWTALKGSFCPTNQRATLSIPANATLTDYLNMYKNMPIGDDVAFMQKSVDLHRALLKHQDAAYISSDEYAAKQLANQDLSPENKKPLTKLEDFEENVLGSLNTVNLLVLPIRSALFTNEFTPFMCPEFLKQQRTEILNLRMNFYKLDPADQLKIITNYDPEDGADLGFLNKKGAEDVIRKIKEISILLQASNGINYTDKARQKEQMILLQNTLQAIK